MRQHNVLILAKKSLHSHLFACCHSGCLPVWSYSHHYNHHGLDILIINSPGGYPFQDPSFEGRPNILGGFNVVLLQEHLNDVALCTGFFSLAIIIGLL